MAEISYELFEDDGDPHAESSLAVLRQGARIVVGVIVKIKGLPTLFPLSVRLTPIQARVLSDRLRSYAAGADTEGELLLERAGLPGRPPPRGEAMKPSQRPRLPSPPPPRCPDEVT